MRYKELQELGPTAGIAAGAVDKIGSFLETLPERVYSAFQDAKGYYNRKKFDTWYATKWKTSSGYEKTPENFADAIKAYAKADGLEDFSIEKIEGKYTADSLVKTDKEGKMRTRVEVIDSLMNDLSLLKAYEKGYGKSKAKNIKDFGMSKPKAKKKGIIRRYRPEPEVEPEKEKTSDFKVGDGKPGNPLGARA